MTTSDIQNFREAMAGYGTGGRLVTIPLGANETQRITARGTVAYFAIATAPVEMKCDNADYSLYYQGTGIESVNAFNILTLLNPNNFPIAVAVWVGFDGYIDRRLILNTAAQPNVIHPVLIAPGFAGAVPIPDLSGTTFTDINNKGWIAISRLQILVSNIDPTNLILLQAFGNSVWNTGAVFAVQPLTEIGLNVQGDYYLLQNGGTVNALVSEVYSAVAYTSNPP
jgi:hypothetical protein